MAKGFKTGGRKPGSVNKTTAEVKAALAQAFDDCGGVPSLVAWAQENPTEFYKLWVKILPLEVNGNMRGALTLLVNTGIDRPPGA